MLKNIVKKAGRMLSGDMHLLCPKCKKPVFDTFTCPACKAPVSVSWGFESIPIKAASEHFLVSGATGSGKTTMIRLLMKSLFSHFGKNLGMRALILDVKRDSYSTIHAMGKLGIVDGKEQWIPPAPVMTLNPLDKRCVAWNMAADIRSHASARQLVAILIPPEPQSTAPYFTDAAREVVRAVMLSFMKKNPDDWTFRDVLLSLRSETSIRKIASRDEESRQVIEMFDRDEKHYPAVLSTIATKLPKYDLVAAAWHRAVLRSKANGRSKSQTPCILSLAEWVNGKESILILGNHPSYSESINPINRAILKTLSDKILSQAENQQPYPKHWLFLDELREAGNIEVLHSLLNQGRSKGASVILGFQDIDGLRAVYTENVAHELAGQCAHKAFLRTGSHATAAWSEQHFGQVRFRRDDFGNATEQGSGKQSTHIEPLILGSKFLDLPRPSVEDGFQAIVDLPSIKVLGHREKSWESLFGVNGELSIKAEGAECMDEDLVNDDLDQGLIPWNEDDFERLKLADDGGPKRASKPRTPKKNLPNRE